MNARILSFLIIGSLMFLNACLSTATDLEDSVEKEKIAVSNASSTKSRFADVHNGTVIDMKTKLMWASQDNGKPLTWYDALSYVKNFREGGYSDWRLPSIAELESLYDDTQPGYHVNYYTRSRVFIPIVIRINSSVIWGSLGNTGSLKNHAEVFYFDDGRAHSLLMDCTCALVLPVRTYEKITHISHGPLVRKAQERLQSLRYDPGQTDGILGWRTQTAIERFQKDNNLSVTGKLDDSTLGALQIMGAEMPHHSYPNVSSSYPVKSSSARPFEVLSAVRSMMIRFRNGSLRPGNPDSQVMLTLRIKGISSTELGNIKIRDKYILAGKERIPIEHPMSTRNVAGEVFELDLSVPNNATEFKLFLGEYGSVVFTVEKEIRAEYRP